MFKITPKSAKRTIAAVLAIAIFPMQAGCISQLQPTHVSLAEQKVQINRMLGATSGISYNEITLQEEIDEQGNSYYVGELSDEMDVLLGELVDVYNNALSTEVPVTEEEARHCLTSGLARSAYEFSFFGSLLISNEELYEEIEVSGEIITEKPYMYFLVWLGALADLEYRRDAIDYDGVRHFEGERVEDNGSITNYKIISNPEAYPDYRISEKQE